MHGVILTDTFEKDADDARLSVEELSDIISTIAAEPTAGDLMVGTGGARKLRHRRKGAGKSGGGYRTIHYFGENDLPVFLLAMYRKGDRDNLSKAERNQLAGILSNLADTYRSSVKTAVKTRRVRKSK